MFHDLKGLVKEIESGKSNEEIIAERLQEIRENEYEKFKRTNYPNSNLINLLHGYIEKNEVISISDWEKATTYIVNEEEIYKDLLNGIRKDEDLMNYEDDNVLILYFTYLIVRKYFRYDKNAKYADLLEQLKEEQGLDNLNAKIEFGQYLNKYLYLTQLMNKGEKINRTYAKYVDLGMSILNTPINISDIKGLGIGECIELAVLSQNILTFLGFNSYVVGGELSVDGSEYQRHQYNVIENNGKYFIYDAGMRTLINELPNVKKEEDLLSITEFTINNFDGTNKTKLTYKARQEREYDRILQLLAMRGKEKRSEFEEFIDKIRKVEINEELRK